MIGVLGQTAEDDLMVEAGCCGQADACKARPLFSFVEEPMMMMMLLEFWVAG